MCKDTFSLLNLCFTFCALASVSRPLNKKKCNIHNYINKSIKNIVADVQLHTYSYWFYVAASTGVPQLMVRGHLPELTSPQTGCLIVAPPATFTSTQPLQSGVGYPSTNHFSDHSLMGTPPPDLLVPMDS